MVQIDPQQQLSFKEGDDTWHLLRKKSLEDLYWFNDKVLGHGPLVPMRPYTHLALCKFASRQTGVPEIDDARVQLIEMPRGSGKSTLITIGRSIQRLLADPMYAIGIANETQEMAKAFLSDIKAHFENNELLKRLFPEVIPPDLHSATWAADKIILNRPRHRRDPSAYAVGVGATRTGSHMNEWVIDDMISRDAAENARTGSYSEIEKTNRWIVQLDPLLMSPRRDPLTFIGTRWWMMDSYSYVRELFGRGEEPREFKWRVKLPGGDSHYVTLQRMGELAIFSRSAIENGKSVFPERYTLEELAEKQVDDPIFFSANYLNDPTAEEARDFKDNWINRYDWDTPKQVRYTDRQGETRYVMLNEMDCIMSVDPAISESGKADRTAVIVSGTIDGIHHLILEARAERIGVLDTVTLIQELNNKYRCRRIYVESVAYQKALAQLLTAKKLPIIEYNAGTVKTKEMRIRSLEPYFRNGHVYLNPQLHEWYHEYQTFPRGKWDDLLDATSMLTDEWSRIIGKDDKRQAKEAEAHARNIARIKAAAVGPRRGGARGRSTFDS